MYVITVNKKSSFHTVITIIYHKVCSYDVIVSAIIHYIDKMKDYPNYEKYGCIDCRWTGIPLITKYVRYLYADRIPRYIYECPVCFSTRIINLKTGKFINKHWAKYQYYYNKITIFLQKAIKRILSHFKKG